MSESRLAMFISVNSPYKSTPWLGTLLHVLDLSPEQATKLRSVLDLGKDEFDSKDLVLADDIIGRWKEALANEKLGVMLLCIKIGVMFFAELIGSDLFQELQDAGQNPG